MLLAIGAALGDHLLDLLVLARMQRLEREILELPLERVDTEPVCERRVHLERLACLLHLLLLAEVLDRAQVVEPVGELDQDHAHVLGHRHDQLAVVLGLGVLPALELDAGQLRDALDERRDLVAELGAQLLDLDPGVLDDVVQQRCRERRLVELEARDDLGHAPWVVDELLARLAHLAGVGCRRVVERARQQRPVDVGLVRLDFGNQLVDEVLMSLEYRHASSVARSFPRISLGRVEVFRRRPAPSDERKQPMLRRRRETKRLLRVARLLRELDAASARPRQPQKARASVRAAS